MNTYNDSSEERSNPEIENTLRRIIPNNEAKEFSEILQLMGRTDENAIFADALVKLRNKYKKKNKV